MTNRINISFPKKQRIRIPLVLLNDIIH